jgi:hypothetical protein
MVQLRLENQLDHLRLVLLVVLVGQLNYYYNIDVRLNNRYSF